MLYFSYFNIYFYGNIYGNIYICLCGFLGWFLSALLLLKNDFFGGGGGGFGWRRKCINFMGMSFKGF